MLKKDYFWSAEVINGNITRDSVVCKNISKDLI